jgi:hypothetical protein
MNISGTIRGGSVSADFSVGRGGSLGTPKKTFGQKLGGLTEVRAQLDSLHSQIRTTGDLTRLCHLVDEYLLAAASLAETPAMAGRAAPAGSLLAALKATMSGPPRPSGSAGSGVAPF